MMGRMKDFEILVSEDIKNKTSAKDKEYLFEHKEVWRDSLLMIIETVSEQIEQLDKEIKDLRDNYPDFDADPASSTNEKRIKANRFRFHAEKKLAEVDRMILLGHEPDPDTKLIHFLRDAILAHKQWHLDNELVPSEGDERLYKVLEGKWDF
tara:strand:+ start:9084 stop:9539 length:456 start_codon:yes stop_codon:yes gene_type:complete